MKKTHVSTTVKSQTAYNSQASEQGLAGRSVQTGRDKTTRRAHWEKVHTSPVGLDPIRKRKTELSNRGVDQTVKGLSASQLPWQASHQVYFQRNDGLHTLRTHKDFNNGIDLRLYGNSTHTQVIAAPQYVSQEPQITTGEAIRHRDSFAWVTRKGIDQGLRNTYPIHTYSSARGHSMDRGHGIDFVLTIPEENHSSIDERNYTPQNSVYNQHVRNLLVRDLEKRSGFSYKEVCMYGKNPPQVVQKVVGKYSESGKVERHSIDVPEGFLFVVFDASKKINMVCYFPNFIDYKKMSHDEGLDYTEIPRLFEIEKSCVKLWGKDLGLFDASVYERGRSEEDIDREVRSKSFVGYRLLSGRFQFTFKQPIKAKEWIPREALNALTRTIALKQLYEMAGSEFTSVEYKLSCVTTLLTQFTYLEINEKLYNPEQAKLWLRRAEEQVAHQSSVEEKLQLHDTYLYIKKHYEELYKQLCNTDKIEALLASLVNIGRLHELELYDAQKAEKLLVSIVRQAQTEGCSIREKYDILDRLSDPKDKEYWLSKIEEQILQGLRSSNQDDREEAISELEDLIDYYGEDSGKPYGIEPNPYKAKQLNDVLQQYSC